MKIKIFITKTLELIVKQTTQTKAGSKFDGAMVRHSHHQ
jgi:hypothetical protein